jgi:hypothetical protein
MKTTLNHRLTLIIAALMLLSTMALAETGIMELEFAGSSHATILTSSYILDNYVSRSGDEAYLELPGMPAVELMVPTSAGGAGPEYRYVPHMSEAVLEALNTVSFPRPVEEIEIVLLPYPRKSLPVSSALGRRIFLSPAPVSTPYEVTAYTVTHELGHLFQYERMPDTSVDLWDRYNELRGIGNSDIYHEDAAHADRPHEIFAEDFRYLFGGEMANYAHNIENHDLVTPDQVEGLAEFMLGLTSTPSAPSMIQSSCFPNPFNPRTEIRVDVDISLLGQDISIQVYDAQGRRVRDVYRGQLYSNTLRFDFNGHDDAGRQLPSGVYFSSVRLGQDRQTTKMILLQ